MFHIGTNNWQRQDEFAPGSGILHASMHQTFNDMPGVRCYSIYPSKKQTDPTDDHTFKIFKLDHDIPICESVSPNSSYRWHSMNDAQYTAYLKRLEDEVCAFMDQAEAREGKEFDFLVTHHAFTNAMTGAQIVTRRRKEGKTKLRHFNFVHGTALKMFIKEKDKDPEYPVRFLPLVQNHGIFTGRDKTQGIWVNSEDFIKKFLDCFPSYPKDYCVFSRIGVNQSIFCPKGTKIADLEKHIRAEDKPKLAGIKRAVTFVGKFADWKRLDVVLYAAAVYEKTFPDLVTAIVGSGPPEAVALYEGMAQKLGLQRTLFLGAKQQAALAELFSLSEVGMFPSYKEPFGMVFIECMACGTPCIGAKSGGPIEFVKEEQGVLIDEEDDWRSEEGAKRLGARLAGTVAQALNEDWKGKTKGPTCMPFVRDNYSTFAQCMTMLSDMEGWSMGDSFWDIPGMKPGVITGDVAWNLLKYAKAKGFAIPAFNCTSTSSVNAVLEAGRTLNRPVMVQFSEGGSAFFAGKSLPNDKGVLQASTLGAVAGALYVRSVAPAYGIPVFVHSDHCAKKLLPWFDGMLEIDEQFFKANGEPLFSSHMLDLSEEPHDVNIGICEKYFKRMAPMNLILEMEIGITGGVEDGVDNSGISKDKLYSTPEDVWQVYEALAPISEKFTIAAAFGNVHGVYKPGNVKLQPELLNDFQKYAAGKLKQNRPFFFVFHGGSGSEKQDIDTALSYGVVKMNVDTDTQWAYWEGLLNFYSQNEHYLQGQIGNPRGLDKPNKSYYDPRKWVRESEISMAKRVEESCRDLRNVN